MKTFLISLAVVLVITAIILGVFYFLGRKMQKKQAEQQATMDAMAQTVNLMVVDKKRMKIKEATMLPKMILEQTPWYLKRSKVAVVKAKVGPKIVNMICEDSLFDLLPLKTELRCTVSGLYITAAKPVRGSMLQPPKKKKFFDRFKKSEN